MKVREGILQPGKPAPNLDEMLIDQSGSNTHTFGRRSRADGDPASASRKLDDNNDEDEATELDREGTGAFNNQHYQEYHRRDLVDPQTTTEQKKCNVPIISAGSSLLLQQACSTLQCLQQQLQRSMIFDFWYLFF